MKRTVCFALVLCILLCVCGCSHNAQEQNTQTEYCRVLCALDNWIVVWTESYGYIYVRQVDPSLEIEPLDTVVMAFSKDALIPESGTFTDFFGQEQTYSYILEKPDSIRHTTTEEPTFG